jgi:hypothetical protein
VAVGRPVCSGIKDLSEYQGESSRFGKSTMSLVEYREDSSHFEESKVSEDQ